MSLEHIMVDLETLSAREDAAILSIGAVRFDLDELKVGDANQEFYVVVDGADCQRHGLRVDFDTVRWWMTQDKAAQAAAFQRGESLEFALVMFDTFVTKVKDSVVWGNGATFDNMILRSAFRACKIPYPVSYRNDLCYRTIRRMFPLTEEEQSPLAPVVAHKSLDDARSQAQKLVATFCKLRRILPCA